METSEASIAAPELTEAPVASAKPKKVRKKRGPNKPKTAKIPKAKTVRIPKAIKPPRKGKGKTGKRYSPEFKVTVIKWLSENNERGSIGRAMRKFGMSYISLQGWLKAAGLKGGKKVKGKRLGRPPGKRGRPTGSKSVSQPTFSKSARKRILKGLKRMGHGIELLAEAFSHIT